GSSLTVQRPCQHPFRMRIPTEIPTSQALRHRERESNRSLSVRTELRIEKSRFRKVGTQAGSLFGKAFPYGGILLRPVCLIFKRFRQDSRLHILPPHSPVTVRPAHSFHHDIAH